MTTDDVNDAAWILVHCVADVAPNGRAIRFTVEERAKLLDVARLYVQVADRYMGPRLEGASEQGKQSRLS